jgi:hypothetical protein
VTENQAIEMAGLLVVGYLIMIVLSLTIAVQIANLREMLKEELSQLREALKVD